MNIAASFPSTPSGPSKILDGIIPLDRQFGAYPKKVVPDCLQPLLFGPDQGDCFALLDAAAIPDLTLILETCGQPHDCLFQGEALETMGVVAPWIVQLAPDSLFTRRLLSQTGDAWGLWDDGVVFLRSKATLDELRRHFRRFTRLYDAETGKWLFFRFYAASTMRSMISAMAPARLARFAGPVTSFIIPEKDNRALLIKPEPA